MTRKSKFFSALAISVAGVLMITTTAYQSKAANPTGAAAAWADYEADDDFNAISSLNTTSFGTFRYVPDGAESATIEIKSGDIQSLESAVKGLARQVTSLGNKAQAADTALDTGAATAIGNLGTTNSTAMGQIKDSIDTLTQKIDTLNETLTNSDSTGSAGSDGTSGSNGIYGEVLKTDFGYVNADNAFFVTGNTMTNLFRSFRETQVLGTGSAYGTMDVSTVLDNSMNARYVIWWTGLYFNGNYVMDRSGNYSSLQKVKTYLSQTPIGINGYSDQNGVYYYIDSRGRNAELNSSYIYVVASLV